MKKQLLLIFSLLFCGLLSAQNITGSWHGLFSYNGMDLTLIFHIEDNDGMYKGMMDSPDQGVKDIPASYIQFLEQELKIEVKNIGLSYTGTLKGDSIVGTFKQGGLVLPMILTRNEVVRIRPQEPIPPFSYHSEDITFYNSEAKINLAGTLTYPSVGSRFPVVVLISGSGLQDRNEEVFGHKPFLVLSDYLTQKGIAVLRFDDRGFAESEGDAKNATTKDFSTDVRAAVDYLKRRKEINTEKIGLLGHSEGGMIAFMLAAEYSDISFIVSMAGPALQIDTMLYEQRVMIYEASGMSTSAFQQNELGLKKIVDYIEGKTEKEIREGMDGFIQAELKDLEIGKLPKAEIEKHILSLTSPWMKYFMKYDPAEDIRKVKCPMLALNGAKDLQVKSSSNLSRIKQLAPHAATREYPDLNHLLQHCQTGLPNEYGKIEETISPEVLKDITDWIKQVTK